MVDSDSLLSLNASGTKQASRLAQNIQKHMEEVKAMGKGELKKRRGMQFNKMSKASNNLESSLSTGGINMMISTTENELQQPLQQTNLPSVNSKLLIQ